MAKYVCTTTMVDANIKKAYAILKGEECNQMRVVVKARGRKHAEEICSANGLYVPFEPNYSSETGNVDEIAGCERSTSGIIFSRICGYKDDIVTLEELREVIDAD